VGVRQHRAIGRLRDCFGRVEVHLGRCQFRSSADRSGRFANRSATAKKASRDTRAFERSNHGAIERGEFNVRFDTLVKVAAGRA
jgi:hypothetical protein